MKTVIKLVHFFHWRHFKGKIRQNKTEIEKMKLGNKKIKIFSKNKRHNFYNGKSYVEYSVEGNIFCFLLLGVEHVSTWNSKIT